MLRSMVFIDYQNFNITQKDYLKSINSKMFNVNYSMLANLLTSRIPMSSLLLKTYLFAHKPCDKLMRLDEYLTYYKWLCSIKNKDYFEVIEGSQEIRPLSSKIQLDISNPDTYTTKEKGTDTNIATHMLVKGFNNAYDVAILVSGDTDYIPVLKSLHDIGKLVILATLPNQEQSRKKYSEFCDDNIIIDIDFLEKCNPKNKLK